MLSRSVMQWFADHSTQPEYSVTPVPVLSLVGSGIQTRREVLPLQCASVPSFRMRRQQSLIHYEPTLFEKSSVVVCPSLFVAYGIEAGATALRAVRASSSRTGNTTLIDRQTSRVRLDAPPPQHSLTRTAFTEITNRPTISRPRHSRR